MAKMNLEIFQKFTQTDFDEVLVRDIEFIKGDDKT